MKKLASKSDSDNICGKEGSLAGGMILGWSEFMNEQYLAGLQILWWNMWGEVVVGEAVEEARLFYDIHFQLRIE